MSRFDYGPISFDLKGFIGCASESLGVQRAMEEIVAHLIEDRTLFDFLETVASVTREQAIDLGLQASKASTTADADRLGRDEIDYRTVADRIDKIIADIENNS